MAKPPAWTSCSSSSARGVAAARQERDELDVGLRELQRSQFVARHPSHVLSDERTRIAVDLALTEVEPNRTFGIRVFGRQDLAAYAGADAELFPQLAIETRVVRFARLALAAWKFP